MALRGLIEAVFVIFLWQCAAVAAEDTIEPEVRVFFSAEQYLVSEGQDFAEVVVEASEPSPGTINATVVILPGNATFACDYFSLSQDVVFEAGDQSKTIQIRILDDDKLESAETVILMLYVYYSSLCTALRGDLADSTLIIQDDEFLGVSFVVADAAVTEGSTFNVQLTALQPVPVDVVVEIVWDDITDCPSDYSVDTSTVTFSQGESLSSVAVLTATENQVWEGVTAIKASMQFPYDPAVTFRVEAVNVDTLIATIDNNDEVAVAFQQGSMSVREDVGSVSLQLSSQGAYTCGFSVLVGCSVRHVSGQVESAAYSVDFGTFDPEQTLSSAFEVSIADDKVTSTAVQSIQCTIIDPATTLDNVVAGATNTLDISVEDNDVTIDFNFAAMEQTITEGNTFIVQLKAEGSFDQDFTVNLVFADVTADVDFASPASVTFSSGSQLSSEYTVISNSDQAWGGTKSFEVRFEFPDDPSLNICLVSGDTDVLTVAVVEDDVVTVSLDSDSSSPVTVGESGGPIELRLTSTGLYLTPFTMDITCVQTNSGQAAAGEDFTSGPYSVEFTDVNVQQTASSTASVVILDDRVAEFTESFVCEVTAPAGVDTRGIVIGDPSSVDITIEDNDDVYLRFQESEYSVGEGDGELVVFFEAFSQVSDGVFEPVDSPTSFEISVVPLMGSADGADYAADTVTVTFSAGSQTSAPVSIAIKEDDVSEGPESFTISYTVDQESVEEGARVFQLDQNTSAVIEDNDDLTVQFSHSFYSTREGEAMEVRLISSPFKDPFWAEISSPSLGDEDANKNCESEIDVDFTNPLTAENQGVVVFAPTVGLQSTILSIPVLEDTITEGTEYFELKLRVLGDLPFNVTPADSSMGIIQDTNELLLRVKEEHVEVVEGNGSTVNVVFEPLRIAASGVFVPGEFSFSFDVLATPIEDSATGGSDFEADPKTVSLRPGQESSTPVVIPIIDDLVSECHEEFAIRGSVVATSVKEGAAIRFMNADTVSVEIEDNDASRISFTTEKITLSEEDGNNVAILHLVASHEFQDELIVQVAAIDDLLDPDESGCIGKTRGDRDYTLSSNITGSSNRVKVRFPPNSKVSDPFRVQIVDDDEEENWEKFHMKLIIPDTAAECGAILGENRTLEALVEDDDGIRVGFEVASINKTGTEGKTVTLNIYRHGRMRSPTKIFIAAGHITTAKKDFKAKKSVTFKRTRDQSEVAKLKIKLGKDKMVEGTESFAVRLTRSNRPIGGFDRRCAVVTIVDPPTSPPTLRPPTTPTNIPTICYTRPFNRRCQPFLDYLTDLVDGLGR